MGSPSFGAHVGQKTKIDRVDFVKRLSDELIRVKGQTTPLQKGEIAMGRIYATKPALIESFVEGIGKRFPKGTKVTMGSRSFTQAALVQLFQELIDAYGVHAAAKTQAKSTKAALEAQVATVEPVLRMFKNYILSVHADPTELADFGLTPRKSRSPLSVEERLNAVKQGAATRKARHTMGKRQKLRIVGTVAASTSDTAHANGAAESAAPVTKGTNGPTPT
jgi:hypothetical protein